VGKLVMLSEKMVVWAVAIRGRENIRRRTKTLFMVNLTNNLFIIFFKRLQNMFPNLYIF